MIRTQSVQALVIAKVQALVIQSVHQLVNLLRQVRVIRQVNQQVTVAARQ